MLSFFLKEPMLRPVAAAGSHSRRRRGRAPCCPASVACVVLMMAILTHVGDTSLSFDLHFSNN